MKKTAVVYDKWLSSLGGGEVVACNVADILKKNGYEVIFVTGKKVPLSVIKERFNIDLEGIRFIEIWNDETMLKKIVQGKDLFINLSFMDYSYGYAKKNIYYVHFPTEAYLDLKGKIFNEIILPFASKIVKPVEFIKEPSAIEMKNHYLSYLIESQIKIAFTYLDEGKTYLLKFSIFYENFYTSLVNRLGTKIDGGEIIDKEIKIDSYHNVVHFYSKIKPNSSTIYLTLNPYPPKSKLHLFPKNKVYLLYPRIITWKLPKLIYDVFYNRINTRLRAGLFINILERLKSYDLILCNSEFTKKWVRIYWKREAKVLYPPVDLLFEKYNLSKIKKNNWICSVGRFFTLGHGKKQEVLIEAFKKLYDRGYKNWQLHLVGGVGNEPSSQEFVKILRKQARGYPIFFHFNAPRKKVEQVLLKSKIYWHATGYGENEKKKPIKFEHFGIAPIEAISGGCVPILYKGGGLVSIIDNLRLSSNLKKLLLFKSKNELMQNTISVISNKFDFNKKGYFNLLKGAYSREAFTNKFLNYLDEKFSS